MCISHTYTVYPYNPDGVFCKGLLQKLDMAGFNLSASLVGLEKKFRTAIGIPSGAIPDHFTPEQSVISAVSYWLEYRDGLKKPPTWRSILDILEELGLGELSQQIREYLSNCML